MDTKKRILFLLLLISCAFLPSKAQEIKTDTAIYIGLEIAVDSNRTCLSHYLYIDGKLYDGVSFFKGSTKCNDKYLTELIEVINRQGMVDLRIKIYQEKAKKFNTANEGFNSRFSFIAYKFKLEYSKYNCVMREPDILGFIINKDGRIYPTNLYTGTVEECDFPGELLEELLKRADELLLFEELWPCTGI